MPGATILINTPIAADRTWDTLPSEVQTQLIDRHCRLFVVDGYGVAERAGLDRRINTVMQTCFFALSKVLPMDEAMRHIQKSVEETFGRRGPEVVRRNIVALESALEAMSEVTLPTQVSTTRHRPLSVPADAPDFVQRVTRLKPGLYNLVPFELGRATEHIDNPYLIARELAGAAPYFLSHGTALELHRMVTQPNFTVYVSCRRRVRPQTVGGYDFRFVHITEEQEFGVMKHWIDKERFVMISDMERTIIDGLRHPAFAGGVTEVAKGLWMKRDVLQVERLVDYARRLGVGAVVRRLGYLLEHYDLADTSVLEPLRGMLTATYQRLDPLLPAEGAFLSRWRLQLNVTPEEPQIHGIPLTASAGRDISLRAVLRALCRSASTHRP